MQDLERAINLAGGVTALAKECGVSQSAVSNWLSRGRVSIDGAKAIERFTGGKITRHMLRPDIFGGVAA